MFITENQDLNKSEMFLSSARVALKYAIESTNIENKKQTVDFIMNEATDYEIMNLIVREEFPKERHNMVDEVILFSTLKEQILNNISFISEAIGISTVKEIITEVDSLYSTQSMLFEQQRPGPNVDWYRDKIKGTVAGVKQAFNPDRAKNDEHAIGRDVKKYAKKAGDRIKSTASDVKDTSKKAYRSTMDVVTQRHPQGSHAPAPTSTQKVINMIKNKASSAVSSMQDLAKRGDVQAIGAAALAALAIYASVKTYKKYFSAAAKACSGRSGSEKEACMNKFKVEAISKQIQDLNAASAGCTKAKNPSECKAVIQKRIEKLKNKASKISKK